MNMDEIRRREKIKNVFKSIEQEAKQIKNLSWKNLNEIKIIKKIQTICNDFLIYDINRKNNQVESNQKILVVDFNDIKQSVDEIKKHKSQKCFFNKNADIYKDDDDDDDDD